ncbi:MAG: DUF4921 family protein [Patescibacteria group bacterium]|nr:DUF4921 family protein [Patescibacteria group bacterium]
MRRSQLRQDPVSGDWIVIAPGRRKRPHDIIKKKAKRRKAPLKGCPFENPQKTGHGEPFIIKKNGSDWQVQVFENKYPILIHQEVCAEIFKKGPYSMVGDIGHQDLVVTRDHNRNFPHLSTERANQVFEVFKERYLMLGDDACIAYISMFHNWGPSAGASIYHPHYQMIALPIIPPDVEHSIHGSFNYSKKHKKCVHCEMIKWEQKGRSRVIYENRGSIAFAPFVSRAPFELRIFPKRHQPFFEDVSRSELKWVVEALQKSLLTLEKNLSDPDYNFFIHTSPILNKKRYKHYHWHIEILPKISIAAGFELGTGIDINVVDPDEAAQLLRVKK